MVPDDAKHDEGEAAADDDEASEPVGGMDWACGMCTLLNDAGEE